MADPIEVECPDCNAPVKVPCRTSYVDDDGAPQAHAERQRIADLRALEHGTCDLCGARMVRGTVEGRPVDAWHPIPYDAERCPEIPNPALNWNGYALALSAGLTPGHPGPEHFIPDPVRAVDVPLTADQRAALATGETVTVEVPVNDPGGWGVPPYDAAPASRALCPECRDGKHPNCVGQALDPVTDDIVPCACEEAGHA